MKKLFILFSALALLAGFAGVSMAGIEGSMHDFSFDTWAQNQICLPCHTPHNAQQDAAPLWNHTLSSASYQLYSSDTMQAVVGQPSGSSKLCLSCHDGTVSLDAFGGSLGTGIPITGAPNLGTDLSNDHPISFTYNSQLATDDPGLFDPTTTETTIGSGGFSKTGPISIVMLSGDNNDQLQCSACHSVHNDYVADPADPFNYLLKRSKEGSAICLTCHNK